VTAPALYTFNPENMSMLTAALQRLTKILQEAKVKEEWKGNPPVGDEIINVEHPGDIIRLWSVLLFLFCRAPDKPAPGTAAVDDQAAFGEGVLWAGSLLIHLMGYRARFEFMDFSYHVLKLAALKPLPVENPKKPEKKKKGEIVNDDIPKARAFLKNVVAVRSINDTIFSCLDTYLPAPPPTVFQLHPPDKDVDEFVPVRRLSLNPMGMDQKERPSVMLTQTPSKSLLNPQPSTSNLSPSSSFNVSGTGEEQPAQEWGEDVEYGNDGSEYVPDVGGEGENNNNVEQESEQQESPDVGSAFDESEYGAPPTLPTPPPPGPPPRTGPPPPSRPT